MDPSSLIFVVIVGIWAVYLLGHWVRRRDLLATARSVDRFSEAMRVLERRPPQPVSSPRSRSYVVTPARLPAQEVWMTQGLSDRPSVQVPRKTTVAATAAPDRVSVRSDVGAGPRAKNARAPQFAERSAGLGAAGGQGVSTPEPSVRESGTASRGRSQPSGPKSSGSSRDAAPRMPRGAGSERQDAAANRARALVLLALLALTPLAWVFVAVTALPIWLPFVLTVALAVHVVRLRRAAMRRRRAARRQSRAVGRTVGGSASATPRSRQASTRPTGRPAGRPAARSAAAPSASTRRTLLDEAAPNSAPSDGGAPATGAAAPRFGEPADQPVPSGTSRAAGAERSAAADGAANALGTATAGGTAKAADEPVSGNREMATVKDETATANDEVFTATGERASANDEVVTATGASATAVVGAAPAVAAGWRPVPVPPPTYTLKPKAPPPVRRPVSAASAALPSDGEETSAGPSDRPADAPAPGFDLDAILERRIASGG